MDPAHPDPDLETPEGVARWRKAQRERLLESRMGIPGPERREADRKIIARLEGEVGTIRGAVVSVYWPFRGEPDLRPFMDTVVAQGGQLALPVVVGRGRPLAFRAWRPGEPLEDGVWGIPIPPEEAKVLAPDVVITPVVGFDRACYRLGYGGGYYDRTLASLPKRPLVVGVGYALAALDTIHPQPHDVPLDLVITERGRPCAHEGGR
jgi:5-formyltetrahydrofolate cyclo-ligase